jgi:CDP-diacylglycerol---glycerol-3-phosphate 3-phosphatidyltransferase
MIVDDVEILQVTLHFYGVPPEAGLAKVTWKKCFDRSENRSLSMNLAFQNDYKQKKDLKLLVAWKVGAMANVITLIRIPLLFVYVGFILTGRPVVIFLCVPFIVGIMLLDMLDGMVARRFNQTSLLGSALDIAVDRSLEIILWVVFSSLGLIPLVIPIIVIARGTLTDAVRCVGTCHGEAAFAQLRHPVNRFLVASRFMRDLYGAVKGTAFAVLTLDFGYQTLQHAWSENIHSLALGISWMTILLTIIRGIPVLAEEISFLGKTNAPNLGKPSS